MLWKFCRVLVNEFRKTDKSTNNQKWKSLLVNGRQLFYHIVQLTSDDTSFYPPAKQLISSCAGILGQVRKLFGLNYSLVRYMKMGRGFSCCFFVGSVTFNPYLFLFLWKHNI